MRQCPKAFPFSLACTIFLVIVLVVPPARAALTAFSASIEGENRQVSVELHDRQGVLYVSLPRVVEQFGGGFNVLPTRMRVDFMGSTAWVGINDNRVNALGIFSLQHPVLRFEGDVLIAVDDVPAFFLKAFRVPLKSVQQRASTPQASPTQPGRPESSPLSRPAPSASPPIGVVVIDAGHGGYESGLEGRAGLFEKDLTLAIALEVKKLLTQSISQRILLTRNEDISLTTQQRALMAVNSGGGLLLSIHGGGLFSPQANGCAIFHAPPKPLYPPGPGAGGRSAPATRPIDYWRESAELANALGRSLEKETSASLRGIQAAPCRLLEVVPMPGVLIEVGCLTNPSEEALLEMDSYRSRIAAGIAKGVIAYLAPREGARARGPAPSGAEPQRMQGPDTPSASGWRSSDPSR